jgi:hypothetical protein
MATVKGGLRLESALEAITRKATNKDKVRVGFLENARYPDGTPVAMVAAIQNFGAPRAGIPPRPFFSNMVQKHRPEWGKELGQALKATGFDAGKSLKQMGDLMAGELRESIVETNSPPLSPVTLLLRQRFGQNREAITFKDVQRAREDIASGTAPNVTPTQGKPLVWTGQLLGSVDSEVT